MTAEIGILGLFAFLWFITKLLRLGMATFLKSKDSILLGLMGAVVAFLTHSLFDVNMFALKLAALFWVTLGLTTARINMLAQENLSNT